MSRRAMHKRFSFQLSNAAGLMRALKTVFGSTSPVAHAAAEVMVALSKLRKALAAEAKRELVEDVYFRPQFHPHVTPDGRRVPYAGENLRAGKAGEFHA